MKKSNIPRLKPGETKYVYQNPDFDEVFIFYNIEVPTSKKEFRPIEKNLQEKIIKLCPEVKGTLYFKGNKRNSVNFINEIKRRLQLKKKLIWPYHQPVLLSIGFMGTKKDYGSKDLDNLVKSVFDAFKGIVFEDDKNVEILITSKQIIELNITGFQVGLRLIDDETINKFLPPHYCIGENIWATTWNEKFGKGDKYNTIEMY